MRILFDTNIFLDIILKRKTHYKFSNDSIKLVTTGNVEGYIAPITLNNIYYIGIKTRKKKQIKKFIKVIIENFKLASVDNQIAQSAINSEFSDFEDALQYFSAEKVNCDYVLTRNLKDYKNTKIPIVSSKELMNILKK